jgi:hypothetical protein
LCCAFLWLTRPAEKLRNLRPIMKERKPEPAAQADEPATVVPPDGVPLDGGSVFLPHAHSAPGAAGLDLMSIARTRSLDADHHHCCRSPTALSKQDKERQRRHALRESVWGRLDRYPTLEEAFKHVPLEVGFNVEVKYPDEDAEARELGTCERNRLVDRVLQVVFSCAGKRRVLFSSFDPAICLLLRLKQATYPVLFLTCGRENFSDPRRNSLDAAIAFAVRNRLHGVVAEASVRLPFSTIDRIRIRIYPHRMRLPPIIQC